MQRKEKLITLILLLSLVGCGFYLGWSFKPPKVEAMTIDRIVEKPVEVIKEVPVEKIITVEKPIVYYQQIEKPIVYYQQTEVKEWESLDQVKSVFSSITFLDPNCLNVAELFQQFALSQGYSVSVALAVNGYYYGQKVVDDPDAIYHAGVLVEVKGHWYFIDPIPWKVTRLF